MAMNRREVLLAGVAASAILSGCAGLAVPDALKTAAADVKLIADGLAGAWPTIAALVPAAAAAQIAAAIAKIQTFARQLSATTALPAGASIVQQVEASINAIFAALGSVSISPKLNVIISAIRVLLPVIEIAVGLLVPATAPRAAGAMTPDQARAVLAAARGQ